MQCGEIWWADLEPPAGRHPVLLLSRNSAYNVRTLVIIAPVTTRIRHINSEVQLGTDDGLIKSCVINLDKIYTIPRSGLSEKIATLNSEKMQAVERAVHYALGLES